MKAGPGQLTAHQEGTWDPTHEVGKCMSW